MSDNPCPPAEAVLLMLQERAHELGEEAQMHQRNLELATARREELLLMIAQLGRKPRVRKARETGKGPAEPCTIRADGVNGALSGGDQEQSVQWNKPIFAPPSGAIVEAE